MDFEEGLKDGIIEYVPEEVIEKYISLIKDCTINDEGIDKDICVVYSPLNGTGNKLVRRILKERGFTNIHVVKNKKILTQTLQLLVIQIQKILKLSNIQKNLVKKWMQTYFLQQTLMPIGVR